MKIRVTDSCLIAGAHAEIGSVHDLPAAEAILILSGGRAVRHVEQPKAPVVAAPEREPVAEVAPAELPLPGTEAASAAPATETPAAVAPATRKRATRT